jgi:phosphate transport system substrate-binding protein
MKNWNVGQVVSLLTVTVVVASLAIGMSVSPVFGTSRSDEQGGRVQLEGSTTLYPVMVSMGEAVRSSGLDVENHQSSSGAGIRALIDGHVDIARASRTIKIAELDEAEARGIQLEVYLIGFGGVAVIVHPDVFRHVQELTADQVRGVFVDGSITDWSQLSPQLSGSIRVCTADAEGGTTTTLLNGISPDVVAPKFVEHTETFAATPLIAKAVASDPLAIGYSPAGRLYGSVRAVRFGKSAEEMADCSPESIRDGSYALRRPLYLITQSTSSSATRSLLEFALSHQGQQLMSEHGFIAVR